MNHLSLILPLSLMMTACSESQTEIPSHTQSPITVSESVESQVQANRVETIEVEGVSREYLLHQNPSLDFNKPMRLVIVLHGYMATHQGFMELTGFNNAADKRDDVVVVYPQGLVANPYNKWGDGTQWDIHWGAETKDVEFLTQLIAKLKNDFPIAENKVYLTGHSNGGFMSYLFACEVSEQVPVAAIAAVGGTLPFSVKEKCESKHPFSVLHIHGMQDHAVPIQGIKDVSMSVEDGMAFFAEYYQFEGELMKKQLPGSNGQPSELVTHYSYQGSNAGIALEYIMIDKMGHTWPGSAIDLSTLDPYVGPTSYELDANETILQFFNRF